MWSAFASCRRSPIALASLERLLARGSGLLDPIQLAEHGRSRDEGSEEHRGIAGATSVLERRRDSGELLVVRAHRGTRRDTGPMGPRDQRRIAARLGVFEREVEHVTVRVVERALVDEPQRRQAGARRERPITAAEPRLRREHVVELLAEHPQGVRPGGRPERAVTLLREGEVVVRMCLPRRLELAELGSALERSLSDRLVHPEPPLTAGRRERREQRTIDQRSEGLGRGSHGHLEHRRGGREREAPTDRAEPCERAQLGARQAREREIDRVPERAVPRHGVARVGAQLEATVEREREVVEREHRQLCRGELDGQRDAVEPADDVIDARIVAERRCQRRVARSSAEGEESDPIVERERPDRLDVLAS